MCKSKIILLAFFALLSTAVNAESTFGTLNLKGVEVTDDYLVLQAKNLSLEKNDIKRYYEIMNSPRGTYYLRGEPNIFFVLASEASSEAERMRFARAWVAAEDRYYENFGKSIRAYTRASMEKYGENPKVWDLTSPLRFPVGENQTSSRVALYIKAVGCDECDVEFNKLYNQLKAGLISGIDIYVEDALSKSADDALKIRTWATKMGMSPDTVKAKLITLNYGEGSVRTVPAKEYR